jgi:hypothetical protein
VASWRVDMYLCTESRMSYGRSTSGSDEQAAGGERGHLGNLRLEHLEVDPWIQSAPRGEVHAEIGLSELH